MEQWRPFLLAVRIPLWSQAWIIWAEAVCPTQRNGREIFKQLKEKTRVGGSLWGVGRWGLDRAGPSFLFHYQGGPGWGRGFQCGRRG